MNSETYWTKRFELRLVSTFGVVIAGHGSSVFVAGVLDYLRSFALSFPDWLGGILSGAPCRVFFTRDGIDGRENCMPLDIFILDNPGISEVIVTLLGRNDRKKVMVISLILRDETVPPVWL